MSSLSRRMVSSEAHGVAEAIPVRTNKDLAVLVLKALAVMAACNRRGEADVGAALHRAGLIIDTAHLNAALKVLCVEGCIAHLVPTWDGGLLVKVTGTKLGPEPRFCPVR